MVFYGVGIDYPVLFEQLKPAPSRLLLVQETQSKKTPKTGTYRSRAQHYAAL